MIAGFKGNFFLRGVLYFCFNSDIQNLDLDALLQDVNIIFLLFFHKETLVWMCVELDEQSEEEETTGEQRNEGT